MKKFIQIITATILSVGLMGSIAGAETCPGGTTIDQSGNNSSVTVTCDNYNNVTLTCVGNVYEATFNAQDSHSGNATVDGNGSQGSAATGTARNSAGNDVTIGVTSCGTSAGTGSTTTSTSPSVAPVAPGKGATVAPAASLPNTAANDTASIIAVSLVSAAAVVGMSRAGVAAYRRFGNK